MSFLDEFDTMFGTPPGENECAHCGMELVDHITRDNYVASTEDRCGRCVYEAEAEEPGL